jgi:hypothetical protein
MHALRTFFAAQHFAAQPIAKQSLAAIFVAGPLFNLCRVCMKPPLTMLSNHRPIQDGADPPPR